MHGSGDEQVLTNTTDAVSDAVAQCNGKFAVGIIALTNLSILQDGLSEEDKHLVGETFRSRLSAMLRPGDDLVVLSDDMLCLVLDDLMDSNHLQLAALKIQRLFEEPIDISGQRLEFGVCSGLVYAGRHTRSTKPANELYQMAENACSSTLLTSKPFTVVDADEQPMDRDWQLNQRIHAAMDNHQITFDYQPKVNLESGELVGGEALIRWREKGEVIPPDEYLSALSDDTLWQLTIYGYRRALREILEHNILVPVAFNIDPTSLAQPDFLAFMTRETNLWGVPTSQIVFEITENKELYDLEESKTLLQAIREQGFKVSLDDFGAGHSNMHRIRELPLDEIKLDRSLCNRVFEDEDAGHICQSIVALAQTLDITVVAEGIEDAQTMQMLQHFGCAVGQGFYLGAPMSVTDFVKLNH